MHIRLKIPKIISPSGRKNLPKSPSAQKSALPLLTSSRFELLQQVNHFIHRCTLTRAKYLLIDPDPWAILWLVMLWLINNVKKNKQTTIFRNRPRSLIAHSRETSHVRLPQTVSSVIKGIKYTVEAVEHLQWFFQSVEQVNRVCVFGYCYYCLWTQL
jgi:hypothetical protein